MVKFPIKQKEVNREHPNPLSFQFLSVHHLAIHFQLEIRVQKVDRSLFPLLWECDVVCVNNSDKTQEKGYKFRI